ncbi:MAG: Mur ligase family protein, partial [Bacteroidales bacterium]|nr:Mur ligase family protein [Bacteroidales bacterium]
MENRIKEIINNKKILILGFGKEGQSTYDFLRKYFQNLPLTIADLNKDVQKNPILKGDGNINFKTGEEYLKNLNEFDLIIKSPGISLNNVNEKIPFEKITSQTDIFFSLFSKQIVGITGTKGKSTTSALICHILESGRTDVIMAGNIGIPVFDIIEKIKKKTVIICETSSHQLEFIKKAPHIAILLNLYQEHLDYYKSYDEYKKAKLNIIKYQSEKDFFIYNFDDAESRKTLEECRYKRKYIPYSFSEKVDNGIIISGNYIACKSGMKEEKFFDM